MGELVVLEPFDPSPEVSDFVSQKVDSVFKAMPGVANASRHGLPRGIVVPRVIVAQLGDLRLDVVDSVAHGFTLGRASVKCQTCGGTGLRLIERGGRIGWVYCPDCGGTGDG